MELSIILTALIATCLLGAVGMLILWHLLRKALNRHDTIQRNYNELKNDCEKIRSDHRDTIRRYDDECRKVMKGKEDQRYLEAVLLRGETTMFGDAHILIKKVSITNTQETVPSASPAAVPQTQ